MGLGIENILTVKSGELLMAADDEIMDVVRLRACPWLSLRFLGSLELVEEILLLLLNGTDVEVDILSWLSWTELERKNSGLGIEKFNLERIFDDSVVGGRIVVSLFVGWGGIAFSGSCRGFITGWGFTTVQECVLTSFYNFITHLLSRSAHWTPNFTNPEFQFPQFKVLQSVIQYVLSCSLHTFSN